MTLYDLLNVMARYDDAIQVGYKGKNSGIMKVGNITYKKISHYCYKKHILYIKPCLNNGLKYIYVQLVDDEKGTE